MEKSQKIKRKKKNVFWKISELRQLGYPLFSGYAEARASGHLPQEQMDRVSKKLSSLLFI